MNNFKSGSGNLNFGNSEEDEEVRTPDEASQTRDGENGDADPISSEEFVSTEEASANTENASNQPASNSRTEKYPYFVRRNNVGDERDTRLELHVRDKVTDQEATFRNELAEYLGANEVSKTDAREFALLAAFRDPERVAELMQDEGFGSLG